MFSAEMKFLPDLWATTLDEILTIRIGRLIVNHELGNLLSPILATVAFDQPIDSGFDLKELGSRSVFPWKIKKQMAVNRFGLTARHSLTRPNSG